MDSVVTANGIDIAVRDYGGTGTPVLLIPGAGRTLADFAPLAGHLVTDHRVVAMDLRNHGKSGDGPWTWDGVLGDVRAVVEHFGLDKPVIAGHSLGGMIAALYFEKYGDLTAAVNMDGHGMDKNLDFYDMDADEVIRIRDEFKANSEQLQDQIGQPLSAEQMEQMRQGQSAMAAQFGIAADVATEAFERGLVDNGDGTFSPRPNMAAIKEMMGEIEGLDLIPLYRRVPGPLMVYNATKPQPVPGATPDMMNLMAAYRRGLGTAFTQIETDKPGFRAITIDATHGLIFEQPELIASQIREFVKSL